MPSPLTRNLYIMDEVVSSLQTSLRINNGRALFWFWELAVSLEPQVARDAAITAWLLWGGGNDPALLTLPLPTTAATTYPLMVRVQTAIQTAKSLNAHRLLSEAVVLSEPPTPTPRPNVLMPNNDDDPDYGPIIWHGLQSALKTKSRQTAAWYLQSAAVTLCADTVWLFLTALIPSVTPNPLLKMFIRLLQTHATPHSDSQLLSQMSAFFILCDPDTTTITPLPTAMKVTVVATRDWDAWTTVSGRRKGRIHAILPSALHAGTTRGALSAAYTNITEVRDPIPSLLQSSCQFWRMALSAASVTYDPLHDIACFPNDDILESFYEMYFADDIPDEWSLVDQYKSHGVGCAETALPAPLPLPLLDMSVIEITTTLAGMAIPEDS